MVRKADKSIIAKKPTDKVRGLLKTLSKLYHIMKELNSTQQLLVDNWQRKHYPLSDILINSLVGLTIIDTLAILAIARKERKWLKSIT